jgi:hypothetical protein
MDSSAFRGIGDTLAFMFCVGCVLCPLGLWKLVEICIWLCRHVHIGIN